MTNKEFAEKLHEAYPKLSVYAAREVMRIIGDIAATELLGGGIVPIPRVGKLKVRVANPRTRNGPHGPSSGGGAPGLMMPAKGENHAYRWSLERTGRNRTPQAGTATSEETA